MATLTIALDREREGRHLLRRGLATIRRIGGAAIAPHKASLSRLYDTPLTVMAVGMVDTAAWQGPHWLGWLVTGVSLFLLELTISDDAEPPRAA